VKRTWRTFIAAAAAWDADRLGSHRNDRIRHETSFEGWRAQLRTGSRSRRELNLWLQMERGRIDLPAPASSIRHTITVDTEQAHLGEKQHLCNRKIGVGMHRCTVLPLTDEAARACFS